MNQNNLNWLCIRFSLCFVICLSPALTAFSGELSAGLSSTDGWITGYFYNPQTGGVAPQVNELTYDASQAYLSGQTVATPAVTPVEEAVVEDTEKVKKDKSNNGVGWGVGGNPEEKLEADGSYHKDK